VGFAAESDEVVPLTAWNVPLTIRLAGARRVAEVDRMGLEAEAELLARETVAHLRTPSRPVSPPVVIEGHPAPVLLDRAKHGEVVVVGRRGVSDLQHRILGSVSGHLAAHAAGPVVIVPASWSLRPCRRIVVGFDGSDHAQAALHWALEVAPLDVEIEALMAVDVIPWLRPELVAERYPDELAAAQQRMLAAADAVDPHRRAVRHQVTHGPRQALADELDRADLVVVGPRGLGGAARAVLGSLTTWLLHDAPCPVAVVPSNAS
jgi:nucleotide-binding universal stress UspA family protein